MAIKMKITERHRTPKQNPNENSRGESESGSVINRIPK